MKSSYQHQYYRGQENEDEGLVYHMEETGRSAANVTATGTTSSHTEYTPLLQSSKDSMKNNNSDSLDQTTSTNHDQEVATIIYHLLAYPLYYHGVRQHPASNPILPPVRRKERHRNYYIYQLNQFRHWWKTSRLLARLLGGMSFVVSINPLLWNTILPSLNVAKARDAKHALKYIKRIGQGGPLSSTFDMVQPGTRTIRIILAIARGWEARVDHRLIEVGIAEALYVCFLLLLLLLLLVAFNSLLALFI
jgi:hypothetical protein